MKNAKTNIKQFDLTPAARAGVFIKDLSNNTHKEEHDVLTPHKDKHYLLLIGLQGSFKLMLDFKEFHITAPALLVIEPGQVHHILQINDPGGWSLSFEPSVIDAELQQALEKGAGQPFDLAHKKELQQHVSSLARLLTGMQGGVQHAFTTRTSHELLRALLSLISGNFTGSATVTSSKESRSLTIEKEFNRLLKQQYKSWKQPAHYAKALSVSVAHLNDTVKSISGESVSAHIQTKTLLEARRLLYFTTLSVKEIGFELGYDNPIHFSKLFKKLSGQTPLQFRNQFRD